MQKLQSGDVVKIVKNGTGMSVGMEHVVKSRRDFDDGYNLEGGFSLLDEWLQEGKVVSVPKKFPVGTLVRIKRSCYGLFAAEGKIGIITKLHWSDGQSEMYEVVVEGDHVSVEGWSFSNDELEAA